ncbi:hypothetical protein PPL_05815 [Heterostelium album PN500]|uniref:Uncharacterized protein n=1 Tax=Heterostelium pallidum (strain ATCC 26659 / Pp 5 / PN500) TaxID=670386 RepID=D3BBE9_HETP5|nr:hypothetical protein PPL_05815 [Heterostelium album PN500]EFA80982.1 hypothetical protein PPL_05815 [Heterostelium album PN500]|eukprot:XP_020433100.1 hypothetical protein PPL_05815 [Heterostelium album PN500]
MEFLVFSNLLKDSKNDALFFGKKPYKKQYDPLLYTPPINSKSMNSILSTSSIGVSIRQESGCLLR